MEVKFRDYQMGDLSFMIQNKKALLLHDPGCGKTPPVCMFLYYVWARHQGKSVWAMPSHLMKKNRDELLLFSDFKEEDVVIISGTRKKKDELIKSNAKVYITSFRGLVDKGEWEKYSDVKCIAVDEMHKAFSTPDTPSSDKLLSIVNKLPFFVGMTGTVIKGRLNSAYVPIMCVDRRFYGNSRDFLAQHALMDMFGKVEGWRNHAKITTILGRIGRRTTFTEAYGEQNPVFFIEYAEMSSVQAKAYAEFEESAAVELGEMMLEGANEGVNVLRLRQILAHPDKIKVPLTKDEKGNITSYYTGSLTGPDEYTGKDEVLTAHMQDAADTGERLLVLCSLVPEQERIHRLTKKLGLRYGIINNNTSEKQRNEYDRALKAGELDGIIGSPKTMATGYNWPFLNHVIFVSVDYDPDDFIQAFRRAIRGVRTQALRVTVLLYRDAYVEQAQLSILDRKSREAAFVDATYEVLNLSRQNAGPAKNVFYS